MEKRFYVSLQIFITFLIILLIGALGFVWESIDVGRFVPFAFITSILIPFILEIIIYIIYCQYIIIDEKGIKKYLFKKNLVEYKWDEICEIRVDIGYVYISLEKLEGEKKNWNKKKYIYVAYSDKLVDTIKKYKNDSIISNI